MLVYCLINMVIIVEYFMQGQENYLYAVNMGCIVLADLYLLYYVTPLYNFINNIPDAESVVLKP